MSTIDRMKIMNLKIMEIKIYLSIYIIIIINNYIMTELWLMISHMPFVINEWNEPHHVLNDLSSLSFMTRVLIINLIIYLKISSSEFTIIMK
jgi:hypothetical protein